MRAGEAEGAGQLCVGEQEVGVDAGGAEDCSKEEREQEDQRGTGYIGDERAEEGEKEEGEESDEGFFTLTNPSSKKRLTASSSDTFRVYSK